MSTPGTSRADATVVVPTRDRPHALARCLAALDAQVGPPVEVIVVDDASDDPAAVDAAARASRGTRVVRASGRGPAAARNVGVAHARTPFVCFTDDDCVPRPDWVTTMSARLASGSRAVAGPTRNLDPHNPYAAASQSITNTLVAVSADVVAGTVAFAPTSNLACDVDLLRDVPFDEAYPLAAGEDRRWCASVAERGVAILYDGAAIVDHGPDLSLRGFWHQHVRYGRGAWRFHHTGSASRSRRLPLLVLRDGFGLGARVGALVTLAQLATLVGVAGERWSTRADRRPH